MMNEERQPKQYDAVLGGNNPPPVNGLVLGGIAGVERRLNSSDIKTKIAAVTDALDYGGDGIDLVIDALSDSSEEFQIAAAKVLKQQGNVDAKQALLNYNPHLFVTTLKDWNQIRFNPEVGIKNQIDNAYILNLEVIERRLGRRQRGVSINHNLDVINSLLQQPQISQIEALICNIEWDYWNEHKQFGFFLEAICDAKDKLSSLRALFIGDREEHQFRKSKIDIFDITPILKAYPNLEVLKVRGRFSEYPLECEGFRHEHLKTLIIETADLSEHNLTQILNLDLPALEYLEIWLGRQISYYPDDNSHIRKMLANLLKDDSFPNLKYLGLKSSEPADIIAEEITNSSLLARLAILDLSMGCLTDRGYSLLKNHLKAEKLYALRIDIGGAYYDYEGETSFIQDEGDRYYALYE
ncbi:conserved hypothetical protein [Hyella patelloides LEGE 07179]|uniref:Uncharacterized protein n=1 Tax=Hyella patelloides LEGE 07179 TaxID=945734 RepID=A0A563VP08_9CYAN|nr:HEAT repeat domain-containing protein [Hyella patelloides]VEP13186.1 conserved hypothetical protein [Hyella patelloides LEGE 07179]